MRGKAKKHPAPAAPAIFHATVASDGPRAFPIQEAFRRISVGRVKGYELIKRGELQTFYIDGRQYATAEAITTFFERRIAESKQTAAQRAQKVAKATQASLISRGHRAPESAPPARELLGLLSSTKTR